MRWPSSWWGADALRRPLLRRRSRGPAGEKSSLRCRHPVGVASLGGDPLPGCAGGGHTFAYGEDLDAGSLAAEVRDTRFTGAISQCSCVDDESGRYDVLHEPLVALVGVRLVEKRHEGLGQVDCADASACGMRLVVERAPADVRNAP